MYVTHDVTRLPVVLEKIIEAQGGLVPDFEMQHNGCSKRKRKLRDVAQAASRIYRPTHAAGCMSVSVGSRMKKRRLELRQRAEDMLGN
eukprot:6564794-Prymnesium_polylepis.1